MHWAKTILNQIDWYNQFGKKTKNIKYASLRCNVLKGMSRCTEVHLDEVYNTLLPDKTVKIV